MGIAFSVVLLLLMIGALADIITREEWQVRFLPKLVWVFLVILLPLVGSLLWFGLGHEWSKRVDTGSFGDPRRWEAAPADAPARSSTEEQLAALDAEIEFHEKQRRLRELEEQLNRKNAAD